MADSKLALSLEKLVNNSARQLGTFQVGVNKILWGNGNTQPIQTVKYIPAISGSSVTTGSLSYTSNIPPPTPKPGNFVESGLFNALDALNQVDLCNVITYVTDTVNVKKGPRPEKPWNAPQNALFTLQDEAALVQGYVDKYVAYPNVIIGSYLGTGPNAVPQNQTNSPSGSGTDAQKYNMYFLMQAIKDTFSISTESTGSLFTAEDKTLLTTVPGLGGNLNIINDFLGTINKYSDYRQISNTDLQVLQNKVTTIRSVCVTIQNLDFKSGLALVGNFLGTDIRNQIQQLSKFIDPTKIIPTLKQINATVRAFIRIANQVLGVLRVGQFIIKLALLFYKIFKFIKAFFYTLPLPSLLTTAGIQILFQDAVDIAKNELSGVARLLKAVNALLSVVVTFIRYLLTNANEILVRLNTILLTLEACEAMKGAAGQSSDILLELQQTQKDLVILQEQLATYIIKFDSKTDPNTAMFGAYDIRVVDEELTDRSIENKRRRGIALDQNGQIVAQSDLTFATNTAVIIAEVKQKLVSLGLVQPNLVSGTSNNLVSDSTNLAIISESLDYLDNNDVIQDDLNITPTPTDLPENLDESKGLGLNAFINNLKGGRKLRRRVRAAMKTQAEQAKAQIAKEKTAANESLRGG
jgi:hypothetical protein